MAVGVMDQPNKKKNIYITKLELESHNTPSDLWISIHGKVYDVTDWLKSHPGGDVPLLSLAGQDVTDAFLAYHPSSVYSRLDNFYIGHLSDYTVSPCSQEYRLLLSEFTKMGLFAKKGHNTLFSFIFISIMFIGSLLGVFTSDKVYMHLLSAAMMGYFWVQSAYLGHDSGHYLIMKSKGWNRIAQLLTGNALTGLSIGWWKRNHNAHHIAVNSLDFDPDLQHLPMFVVSSKFFSSLRSCYYDRKMNFDAVARFLVSYQHITFYPVMCFARLNLFAQSVVLLVSNKRVPDRWEEIAGLVVFYVWYPLFVCCLPSWWERVLYVLVSLSVTSIQHVQFTLNHFSGAVYVGPPTGNDWFEKQTMGTVNIDCPAWMDWFHGGLQFQIEHHLFPRMPRCHFRKIAPLVRELCKKHNLQYVHAGFVEANRRTLKILRTAAMEARDLGNPVPKNLVWEAVNIHG